MAVDVLEHFTVRCTNLERTRDFYSEVIGLRVGPRPDFDFAGYWLYLGEQPVVHLVLESERKDGRAPRSASAKPAETGALDHIAFRGRDLEATRALLRARGLEFAECAVPGKPLFQIFVRDPDGVLIELNFRGEVYA
ncbi:MAG: VOC family protein [Alphaproteobacteria bacterium]|nr:VOC family protein [Alphaproteobacteria bacterium]MDE2113127.1 VOC family protein [Alphaproteobacteria bacterium]MDE2492276.1 VOC family protein [Alphaproteobacteria bacterium]